MSKRLLITPGEPAGIGPDITIQLAQQDWPHQLIVIADPDLLIARAKLLNLPLTILPVDLTAPRIPHRAGTLAVLPIELKTTCIVQQLNITNAAYVLQTLETAAMLCLQQQADAIVTGPVHKAIMNEAGIPFTGHTEFFASQSNVHHTVMLFVLDSLKVAIATTHLALKEVAKAITKESLRDTITTLSHGLAQSFGMTSPRILVSGVNPHAGEAGHLGREEIDTITPLLDTMRNEGYHLDGPFPADTIFTPPYLARADAILAMYHDQALPLVKYIGFGHAVNVTLGLPFIRTSVDHGTALNLAGTGLADASSLISAFRLALTLQHRHR